MLHPKAVGKILHSHTEHRIAKVNVLYNLVVVGVVLISLYELSSWNDHVRFSLCGYANYCAIWLKVLRQDIKIRFPPMYDSRFMACCA
jgi:hypothetical protein